MKALVLLFALFLVALTPLHAAEGIIGGQATAHTDVLTWTASTTPGVVYSVYRAAGACSTSSSFVSIGSGVNAVTYTDATPLVGVQCYYVTATITVNGVAAESIPSNKISLTSLVLPQQPQPPTGLAGTAN
jgi:hypothetical protein